MHLFSMVLLKKDLGSLPPSLLPPSLFVSLSVILSLSLSKILSLNSLYIQRGA